MYPFENKPNLYDRMNLPQSKIEINPLDYEDTIFKEMADDIKQSQENIDKKLDVFISENKKSSKTTTIISIFALIVGILTLLATLAGIIVQFV